MLIGVISVGLMNLLPKNTILSAIGQNRGVGSILRAAAAGIVLDLCNHGLLLIAGKLYKSGVRYSQVLAFLIASPWNSLSLTIGVGHNFAGGFQLIHHQPGDHRHQKR